MAFGESHSSVHMYLTEFRAWRAPGGILALIALVSALALLQGGTPLAITTCLLSVPILLFSARRRIATLFYGAVCVALHIAYWVSTAHRSGVLFDERVLMVANLVTLLFLLASSWFHQYQYQTKNAHEQFDLEYEMFNCGIPIMAHNSPGRNGAVNPLATDCHDVMEQ